MPALKNARRERFCQLVAAGLTAQDRGMSQTAAYKAAGYATQGHSAEVCASRLLRNVEQVIARVAELQRQSAKRAAVTVDTIAAELNEARDLAQSIEQPSAMVAASTSKAMLYGLFIDKTEQGKAGDFTTAKDTSDLADMRLREANPSVMITEDMRIMALNCMREHAAQEARELAAIASGIVPSAPLPRKPKLAREQASTSLSH